MLKSVRVIIRRPPLKNVKTEEALGNLEKIDFRNENDYFISVLKSPMS